MIDRFIRDTVNLLIYGGAYIGLCAACVTALTFELTGGIDHHMIYIFLIGTATAALYCVHRVIGLKKLDHIQTSERFAVIRKYKHHIWIYCGIWLAMSVWLFLPIASMKLLLLLLPGGLVAVSYVLPVLAGGKRLRDLGWSKIVMIGFSWAWLTAFIPMWYYAEASLFLSVVHGIERMFFIMLITIPFEIRDMHVDRSEGLITLPEKFGVPGTKNIAVWLYTTIVFLSVISSFHYLNPSYTISMGITCLLATTMIRHSYTTDDDYFFGGLTDGLMVLALVMYSGISVLFKGFGI